MNLSFLALWLPNRQRVKQLIDSASVKPSTYNSQPTYDITVRNSRSMPYDLVKDVYAPQVDALCEMIGDATGLREPSLRHGKVLCYDVDGHFERHQDTRIDERHRGTILIFPPKNDWSFEGGNLLCDGCQVDTHRVHQWNLIFIPLGIEHQVLPVTHGQRIVFKYALFADGTVTKDNKLLPFAKKSM